MRRDGTAKGVPTGKSWRKSCKSGYPFQSLFMNIQLPVSTPAACGRRIRSKNRVWQHRKHGSVRGAVTAVPAATLIGLRPGKRGENKYDQG